MHENESPPRSKTHAHRDRVAAVIDAFGALTFEDLSHLTGRSLQIRMRPVRHTVADMESVHDIRIRQSH